MEQEEYPAEPMDTDSIFAKFTRKTLSDSEVMALSMASIVCNPNVPACEIYLTHVAHCDCYVTEIREFCLGLARQLASSRRIKGNATYPFMRSYSDAWGKYAVADAMVIAFLGSKQAPEVTGEGGRSETLGIHPRTYRKVRDFIAAVLKITVIDYRDTLEWAMGRRRDSILQSRWGRRTGLSVPAERERAIMGREKPVGHGCYYIAPATESDFSHDNKRVNIGFDDDSLWRP